MTKTSPERQIEIERLTTLLMELSVDGVVDYGALSAAIGRNVQEADTRPILIAARKRAEKLTGQRFETLRAVGIKRLAAVDVPGIGLNARARIRRASSRAFKRLTDLSYNDVDSRTRARIDAERSVMGAISALTKEQSITTVREGSTTGPVSPIDVYRALTKHREAAE